MASKKEKSDPKSKTKKKKGNFFFGFLTFIFYLIILTALVAAFRNPIAKIVLSKFLSARTGVDIRIEYLNIDLKQPVIAAKEVHLVNPVGFEDEFMAYAPEIYIKYDPKGFLRLKFIVERLNLNLKQLYVLKNTKGIILAYAINDKQS